MSSRSCRGEDGEHDVADAHSRRRRRRHRLGSARAAPLRPALVQVLSGILDEGLALQDAVDRPRLHSAGEIVRVEPGFDEDALTALEHAGYDVRRFARSTTTSAASA